MTPTTPERVIVDALAGSRQYLAELGHSYAGKWLDANARHFIAKRALDALDAAGYEVVPCWNQPDPEPPCCDYRDHGGQGCPCPDHPQSALHPFGRTT